MFGTKKFLLLLLAIMMMVGSLDASAVPQRQLSSKKDGGMEEETQAPKNSGKNAGKSKESSSSSSSSSSASASASASASSSTKASKKAAMNPAPTPPMTEAPKPTGSPKTTAAPKTTDAPKTTAAPKSSDSQKAAMESKKGSKRASGSSSGNGGSGKGSKNYSGSSSSSDSGKGKGGKGKGGNKGTKKGSKRSGAGKGGDGGGDPSAPHAPGTPTPAPNAAPTNATAVPTSMDSFAVRPAPYALYYTFENDSVEDATIDQFNELADCTRKFLEAYFTDKYAQTSIIVLDDFLTFLTRSDAAARPSMGVFRSVARFNPSSIFYPPRSEIEAEIKLAFDEPASQLAYLKKLTDDLSDGNPFKTVASVTYGEPTDSVATASTASGFATAGIAAAAAGVVVLVAGIALLSRNRNGDEDASVDSNFPPANYKKTTTGSVAGETCAGTTWRSSVNEEELQDEPLDDDGTQRQQTSKLNVDY